MTVSIDVTAFDDTELGAEIRELFSLGASFVALYDGTKADQRASTWIDGTRGLWKLQCAQGHVWLSGLDGRNRYLQGECPICHLPGESPDA